MRRVTRVRRDALIDAGVYLWTPPGVAYFAPAYGYWRKEGGWTLDPAEAAVFNRAYAKTIADTPRYGTQVRERDSQAVLPFDLV